MRVSFISVPGVKEGWKVRLGDATESLSPFVCCLPRRKLESWTREVANL